MSPNSAGRSEIRPFLTRDLNDQRTGLPPNLPKWDTRYWDEGYPAVMLTNTAMCRNPHCHLATDTPDKLNYPVMAVLTERLVEALRSLLQKS